MDIIKISVPACLVIAVSGVFLPAGAFAQDNAVRGSIPSSVFDTDSDGSISKQEFNSVFSEFDANADGKLNREEIVRGRREMMDRRYATQRQQNRGMRHHRMGGMMPSFESCDLNGDGRIPEEEFNRAREKRMRYMSEQGRQMMHMADRPTFSQIDSNGDGAIDRDEFRKHQDMRRQQMRKHRDMMREKRREMYRQQDSAQDWQPWDKMK